MSSAEQRQRLASPGRPRRRPGRVASVLWSAAAVTLVIAACGDDTPTDTAGLTPETISSAERLLQEWVEQGNAAGVMAQVSTSDGTWSAAVGDAETTTETPMTLDLQHRIGSVTKTFTTTLILMLVEEGKLSLDDPVSRYVDGVPNGDSITIRMLGSMTSGLAEYLGNTEFRAAFLADPARTWRPQELLDASYALGQDFEPGSSSGYSNTNTVLLGLVAEQVGAKPFDELLEEKILTPHGLDATTYPADASFEQDHVHGYSTLDPAHDVIESTAWSPSQAQAAGQMTSTVGDLTKWGRLLGTGALLSPELHAERLQWEAMGDNDEEWHYTFGIEVNSGWLGHNGLIPGYMTYVVYHPELDATIVLVQNSDQSVNGEPGINALFRELSALLFPAHPVNVPFVG